MYDFVTGPLVWLSFAVFFVGLILRAVLYIRGLDWKLDRVTYSVNTSFGVRGAVRSIVFWLFPFGTRSWRNNPWFTLWVFMMHIGLLLTPVFLLGHSVLMRERLGFSLWSLPEGTADALTILVIVSVIFLALRRIALPEVRLISSAYDYLLLAIDQEGEAVTYVWHRDDAAQMGEYRQVFGPDWTGQDWRFEISANTGKVYLDSFTELSFGDIR